VNLVDEPFYLPRDGREPARWLIDTDDVVTAVEVRLTTSSAWVAADYADGVASLMVRGPAFTITGDGVVSQLVTANCVPDLRVHAGGSYVIRHGQAIILR
jgi:hypothetical protein